MKGNRLRIFISVGLVAASILMFGCGSANNNSTGGNPTSGSNVQALSVNGGPSSDVADGAFTSVTVCAPGSSSNCQTISGILVDTGSSGLRILSTALSVSLPPQTNSSSNPIAECAAFADGITWGAVDMADVKISGETASSMRIQVIGPASLPNIPKSCTGQGVPMDDIGTLHANGLLGVASSVYDCGTDCVLNPQPAYYACVSAVCSETTESLVEQVQNPVASFTTDNNGLIIELPAVTGAEASVNGSLIFGIGTQSNNGLGGAKVFGTDSFDDLTTIYKNIQYSSFLDSGSNGIYFLDSSTSGFPLCSGQENYLYCPSSQQSITVTNNAFVGTNGASGSVTFTLGNGASLLSAGNNAAIDGLGGPGPLPPMEFFDFGLPFFFGRKVFTAIEGKSTPGGMGPYLAY